MTTEELNALIAQAEGGDVVAMNQLGHFYMIHHEVENLIMDGFLELTDSFTNKLRQHPLPQGWQWVNRENLEEKTLNSCVAAFRECIQANIQVAKKVIESGSGERLDSFISDTLIIELTYFIKKISTTLNETLNGVLWATFNAPKESSFANMAQAVMDFVQENLKISHEMDEMKNYEMAFYWHKKAAECGNINSVVHLGECYLEGIGAEQNIDLAIKMLEKAANQGDVWSMNKLTYIYGELDGYINQEQAAKWFLALIQKDCDPNSGVYEQTGYNKDLYEKIKNAILNSASGNEMSSFSGSSSGGSLLGKSIYFTSSNATSYIYQAIRQLIYKTINEALINVPSEIINSHNKYMSSFKIHSSLADKGWIYKAKLSKYSVHVSIDNDIQTNLTALKKGVIGIYKLDDQFLSFARAKFIVDAIMHCAVKIEQVLPIGYDNIKMIEIAYKSIDEKNEYLLYSKWISQNMEALKKYIFEIIEKIDERLREVTRKS